VLNGQRNGRESIDVAEFGRFKAGKSSFLNSLTGRPVLPIGVVPLTAVVTRLRSGRAERAEAHSVNGTAQAVPVREIGSYVCEDRNPGNEKGVASVDVELPELRQLRLWCLWTRRAWAARSCTIRKAFWKFLVAVGLPGAGDFAHKLLILLATQKLAPSVGQRGRRASRWGCMAYTTCLTRRSRWWQDGWRTGSASLRCWLAAISWGRRWRLESS
jgi:hypothetical protein